MFICSVKLCLCWVRHWMITFSISKLYYRHHGCKESISNIDFLKKSEHLVVSINRQVLSLTDLERMLGFLHVGFSKARTWEQMMMGRKDFDTHSSQCLFIHSCFTSVSFTRLSPSLWQRSTIGDNYNVEQRLLIRNGWHASIEL